MTENKTADSAEKGPTRLTLSDGSSWPLPDVADDGVAWRLRYGVRLSSAETMQAAQIIEAYTALLTEFNRPKRELVVGEVRAHLAQRPSRPGEGG